MKPATLHECAKRHSQPALQSREMGCLTIAVQSWRHHKWPKDGRPRDIMKAGLIRPSHRLHFLARSNWKAWLGPRDVSSADMLCIALAPPLRAKSQLTDAYRAIPMLVISHGKTVKNLHYKAHQTPIPRKAYSLSTETSTSQKA